jgi:hypothetical protein
VFPWFPHLFWPPPGWSRHISHEALILMAMNVPQPYAQDYPYAQRNSEIQAFINLTMKIFVVLTIDVIKCQPSRCCDPAHCTGHNPCSSIYSWTSVKQSQRANLKWAPFFSLKVNYWVQHKTSMSCICVPPDAHRFQLVPRYVGLVHCSVVIAFRALCQILGKGKMGLVSHSSNHEAFTIGEPDFVFWVSWVKMLYLEIAVYNQRPSIQPPRQSLYSASSITLIPGCGKAGQNSASSSYFGSSLL